MPMHFAICSPVIHRNQCIIKISRSSWDSLRSASAIPSSSIRITAPPTGKVVYSSRVAVIYRKLGHFCLGQFFQRCETLLAAANLAIAVARLAFQHLLAVAVKGVLLVLVVAVRFQVLTFLRAGRQFFSSPFAHYSFTNGPVWPVFWSYLKNFLPLILGSFRFVRVDRPERNGGGERQPTPRRSKKRVL